MEVDLWFAKKMVNGSRWVWSVLESAADELICRVCTLAFLLLTNGFTKQFVASDHGLSRRKTSFVFFLIVPYKCSYEKKKEKEKKTETNR